MSEWKLIDSAPKDGSNIILAWKAVDTPGGEPRWFQTIGCWDNKFSLEWDDDAGKSINKAAWTDYTVASWAGEEFCELHPTHWAPLLTPPGTDEEQEPYLPVFRASER